MGEFILRNQPMQNYHDFLKEIFRVLKPDGQLIISTPNRDLYAIYNKNKKNEYHTREFDEHEFREFMKRYFEIKQINGQLYFSKKDIPLLTPYTSKPIPIGPNGLLRKLVRVCMRTFIPDGSLRNKLISLEIWANKCSIENIQPSNCIYMIGLMRKENK